MHDRVMVAIDPRAAGNRAVEEAAVLARSHQAELLILVAYATQMTSKERREHDDAPYDQQWRLSPGSLAEAAAQRAVERARPFAGDGVTIRTQCEPGKPAKVLPAATRELDVDLLVVELTGHGPTAVTPRVARALERKADCEVLVIAEGGAAPTPVWAPASGGEALTA